MQKNDENASNVTFEKGGKKIQLGDMITLKRRTSQGA